MLARKRYSGYGGARFQCGPRCGSERQTANLAQQAGESAPFGGTLYGAQAARRSLRRVHREANRRWEDLPPFQSHDQSHSLVLSVLTCG